jgi:NitT/TauT family transport system ATP-binding protein
MAEVVTLKNITKLYHTPLRETEALRDISFSVHKKEFISIIGPSGCGKSTVLSIIAGLESASGGQVISCDSSRIGYMLQQDHLFPWLSVRQNTFLGLDIRKQKTKDAIERVDKLLLRYGLDGFKNSFPSELSGGMRQRAALIRTLALDPAVLLLDEPFSALDYQTRLAVSDDIHSIIKNEGKTAILVTHDISEAISMSDRIVVLTKRPAIVKNIYSIKLSGGSTPIERRKAPEFSFYFQTLWEELNEDE